MEGIMVEFILWTDNPKTDIDKISHYIGIQPIEKKENGRDEVFDMTEKQ